VDAIAVWFDLHLFKDVFVSTAPSWDLCWEQAIFPQGHLATPPQDCLATPCHNRVRLGDRVLLHASSSSHSLHMEASALGQVRSSDSVEKRGGDEGVVDVGMVNDVGDGGVVTGGRKTFFVERGDLLRLNDGQYEERWGQALEEVLSAIRGGGEGEESDDEEEEEGTCVVMCVHQGLSVSGLAAAKLGQPHSNPLPALIHSSLVLLVSCPLLPDHAPLSQHSTHSSTTTLAATK